MTQALLWDEPDGSSHVFVDTLHPRAAIERKAMFEGMQKKCLNLRLVEIDYRERRDTIPSQPHPDCMSARLDGE